MRVLPVILLLIALGAPGALAAPTLSSSALFLIPDIDGRLEIVFTAPDTVTEGPAVSALAEAFHCGPTDLVATGSAQKHELRVTGACSRSLQRSEDLFAGFWRLSPLMGLLRAGGVGRFDLTITAPALEVSSVNFPLKLRETGDERIYTGYWRLDKNRGPDLVTFTYGVADRAALYRAGIAAGLLLALAIAVAAAASHRTRRNPDRAAAWFGYRTLVGLVAIVGVSLFFASIVSDRLLPARLWLRLSSTGAWRCVLVPLLLLSPIILGEIVIRQISLGVDRRLKDSPLSRGLTLLRSLARLVIYATAVVFLLLVLDLPRAFSLFTRFGGVLVPALGFGIACAIARTRLFSIRFAEMPDGELRHRIEGLAAQHGVRFQRIMLVSGSPADIPANAWVQSGDAFYTEALLRYLSRSEIDGITLAEISRANLNHPNIVSAMKVVLCIPVGVALWFLSVPIGSASIVAAPLGVLMILSLYAYVLRRLCRSRDRLCARLSDDPAGLIAALVRLADINREPLTRPWWQAWLSSHPPMMPRLRGIAAVAQLSEEQLQAGIAAGRAEPHDRYALAPTPAPPPDAAPEPAVAGAPRAS